MENFFDSIIFFFKTKSVSFLWILFLFFVSKELLKVVARKITKVSGAINLQNDPNKQKRAETLSKIVLDNGNIVIDVVIVIMVLSLFGLDITPILAGLGIVGIALGFGAQSLVKDFVSGLFILIENQYNIGDKVQIGGQSGTVSKITLRSTILEDDDKKIYYISNGSISSVVNFSQK